MSHVRLGTTTSSLPYSCEIPNVSASSNAVGGVSSKTWSVSPSLELLLATWGKSVTLFYCDNSCLSQPTASLAQFPSGPGSTLFICPDRLLLLSRTDRSFVLLHLSSHHLTSMEQTPGVTGGPALSCVHLMEHSQGTSSTSAEAQPSHLYVCCVCTFTQRCSIYGKRDCVTHAGIWHECVHMEVGSIPHHHCSELIVPG